MDLTIEYPRSSAKRAVMLTAKMIHAVMFTSVKKFTRTRWMPDI